MSSERVALQLEPDSIVYEGEGVPESATYKILVDASDARTITIRVSVRQPTNAVWPR